MPPEAYSFVQDEMNQAFDMEEAELQQYEDWLVLQWVNFH